MPPKNIDENIQKMTQERRDELQVEELPRTLGAATAELEKDELLIQRIRERACREDHKSK